MPLLLRIVFVLLAALVACGCYEAPEVCQPECGTRECGPDPRCGLSCGICPKGEVCREGVGLSEGGEDGGGDGGEDAGYDGGRDAGDGDGNGDGNGDWDGGGADEGQDPCEGLDEPDCQIPSALWNDQGPDRDGDGWGLCFGCDCDDDEPATNPGASEVLGDGVDNNCNGLIDEPGGDMVRLPGYPNTWIDKYEVTVFASPDCSGVRYGESGDDYPAGWPAAGQADVTLYACSKPGLVPSGWLSWHRAGRACQAQGKRLCSSEEHGSGCRGGDTWKYPYAPDFLQGFCNDALEDGLDPGAVVPTGSYEKCQAPRSGTWDASGNLSEWLSVRHNLRTGNYMVGSGSWFCEFCDPDGTCRPCSELADPENGVRWLSDCHTDRSETGADFPPDTVKAYLGTRCCYTP